MKIEKISEFQIRCTLTSEDLADRHIRLSELAYGTEKAKQLFHDMMSQARKQVGFNAENIPLMIEAIPVSPDSIMLVITKVTNPEELDTRFAKFAPSGGKDEKAAPALEGADAILNMLKRIVGDDGTESPAPSGREAAGKNDSVSYKINLDFIRLYRFTDMDSVISAACALTEAYNGTNTLYKMKDEYPYILIIHKSLHSAEEFNRICNTVSEYGIGDHCTSAKETWLKEHAQEVISGNAVQQLRLLRE